jgi:hypothetical protein
MRFSFSFYFLILFFNTWAQDCQLHLNIDCDTAKFSFEQYKDSLAFYESFFGKNKDVKIKDEKLKLAFFVALRHFPELKESALKIKLKSISTTMQAQPKWTFIFRAKENRGYQILVNRDSSSNGMYYRDLSFNSLVGWIGHEFAHILDYSKKDNFEMIGFIADYVTSKERMKKVERKADKETIRHGLGIQLLDGVTFFHENRRVTKEYRERKKNYYLSPEEIIAEIQQNCD